MDKIVDDITKARIGKKLSPDQVRLNLLSASYFLSAFELLRQEIVTAPNVVFMPEFDEHGTQVAPIYVRGRLRPTKEYRKEVSTLRKRDPLHAACLWLVKMEAITNEDCEAILDLREYRNEVAHELPYFLIDIDRVFEIENFSEIVRYVAKVSRWAVRVDMSCQKQFDGQDVSDDDIVPGSLALVQLMAQTLVEQAEVEQ